MNPTIILYKHFIAAVVWFIIVMIYAFSDNLNKESAMMAGLWLFTALPCVDLPGNGGC